MSISKRSSSPNKRSALISHSALIFFSANLFSCHFLSSSVNLFILIFCFLMSECLITARSSSSYDIFCRRFASCPINPRHSIFSSSEILALSIYSTKPQIPVTGVFISCARLSINHCLRSASSIICFMLFSIVSAIIFIFFPRTASSSLPFIPVLVSSSPPAIFLTVSSRFSTCFMHFCKTTIINNAIIIDITRLPSA